MITDTDLSFADGVSVAAVASTINVGDVVDLSLGGQNTNGDGLYLVIAVDTGIITGGVAGTIRFQLVSDDNAALTSPNVHFQTGDFITGATPGELVAGTILFAGKLPIGNFDPAAHDGNAYQRYLGVRAVIGTTTTTAGLVDAFLTPSLPAWRAYKAAI